MKVATGKSILNGIAIGTIRCFHRQAVRVEIRSQLTPEEEEELRREREMEP